MIPILVGSDQVEASRLHDVMLRAGMDAALIDSLGAVSSGTGVLLSHVSQLSDALASPYSVLAFGGSDRAREALACIRQGALEYLPAGVDGDTASDIIRAESERLKETCDDMVVASDAVQYVFDLARKAATTDISVLIAGPSGSGKEVLARYLHETSSRASGPFIAVNCAAIPETMLEAMLFGHEKGAFTGARDKRLGKFELADGGTLLLDEVTEMPLGLQAKLLRVLQEREVERLGSHETVAVDVRVVATTNRDVGQAVKDGILREDLYYRLNVFPLTLPPLRERVADIAPLCRHFLHKHAGRRHLTLAEDSLQLLESHQWPGNVRELENVLQRAIVLTDGAVIEPQALAIAELAESPSAHSLEGKLREAEDDVLLTTLQAHNGVRKATAQALGISERTLRYKLKILRDRGLLGK